jgi:hypothetical protein
MSEQALDRKVLRVIEGGCVWKEKPAQLLEDPFYPIYCPNMSENCVKSLLRIFSTYAMLCSHETFANG